MPYFEQNLSICIMIPRVAIVMIRVKYFVVINTSTSEQGREALSSIGEPRRTETKAIQILLQLPDVLFCECA